MKLIKQKKFCKANEDTVTVEVFHFLFSTFPRRQTSIIRKSLPRMQGGGWGPHASRFVFLCVASGDRGYKVLQI